MSGARQRAPRKKLTQPKPGRSGTLQVQTRTACDNLFRVAHTSRLVWREAAAR